MAHIKNIAQIRFGKLVAIQPTGRTQSGNTVWECLCDCGNTTFVRSNSLTQGITKSCGCWRKEFHVKGFGIANLNALANRYKRNARKRDIPFNISIEDFEKITQRDCYYCGASPRQRMSDSNGGDYIYSGIDRIDSRLGYEAGNIVPCCKICNYMKRTMSHEEFVFHISCIYNHQKEEIGIA